jgi:hypothetical protein
LCAILSYLAIASKHGLNLRRYRLLQATLGCPKPLKQPDQLLMKELLRWF